MGEFRHRPGDPPLGSPPKGGTAVTRVADRDEQLRAAIWKVFRDNSPDSTSPHNLEDEPTWVRVLVSSFATAAKEALASAHDARVSELLEANNREVERRRAAEGSVARLLATLSPFAAACTFSNNADDVEIDDSLAAMKITFGDLRQARTVYDREASHG